MMASSSSTAAKASLPVLDVDCTAATSAMARGAEGAMMLTMASIRRALKAGATSPSARGTRRTPSRGTAPAASPACGVRA